MSRPPKNPMAMKQLGSALTALHKKTPATPKDIELWAYALHGVRLGEETIRKARRGEVDPTTCSLDLLVALVAFYGATPDDLGHHASNRIAAVLAMAGHNGPDDSGGQEFSDRAWIGGNVVDLGARRSSHAVSVPVAA